MQSSKPRPTTGERLRAHREIETRQHQRDAPFSQQEANVQRSTPNVQRRNYNLTSRLSVRGWAFGVFFTFFCGHPQRDPASSISKKTLKLYLSDLERTGKDRILNQKTNQLMNTKFFRSAALFIIAFVLSNLAFLAQ